MTRCNDTKQHYEEEWSKLNKADKGPSDLGEIVLLVTRASAADMPKGQDKISTPLHKQPTAIRFSPSHGIEGDRWKPGMDIDSQISLTSLAVARLIAPSPEQYHLFGNNLVVDFDLSAAALAVGTRLSLGTGEIEISPEPHEPCDRYEARFGKVAHDWVGDKKHKERHLRGRLAKVIVAGEVSVGDTMTVVANSPTQID